MALYADVKSNHLTFDGKQYFRGGAEDIEIGAYGEKKAPVFGQNYLEVQGQIPTGRLKVTEATEAAIDWSKTSSGEFGGSVKFLSASGSASASYTQAKSAQLKLVKFVIAGEDVRSAANDSPAVVSNLRRYGSDARIAHQVFVAMDAKLAASFTNGADLDASGTVDAVKVTAKSKTASGGSTTVTLSKGTTFAYSLVKLDWNDDKSRIAKVTDDQHGLV